MSRKLVILSPLERPTVEPFTIAGCGPAPGELFGKSGRRAGQADRGDRRRYLRHLQRPVRGRSAVDGNPKCSPGRKRQLHRSTGREPIRWLAPGIVQLWRRPLAGRDGEWRTGTAARAAAEPALCAQGG